jgi:hypothetical protein
MLIEYHTQFENEIDAENINFIFVKNEGYDFKKYRVGLEKKKDQSRYTLLMNDSFFITRNIPDVLNKIDKKMKKGEKFIGFMESSEVKTHFQSWFWIIHENLKNDIISMLSDKVLNQNKLNLIRDCEIGISNYLIKKVKSGSIYKIKNNKEICDNFNLLLKDNYYPIIKFQLLKWGIKYELEDKLPDDFVAEDYLNFHPDLYSALKPKDGAGHFLSIGRKEGRIYKIDNISQEIKNIFSQHNFNIEKFIY